MDILDSTLLSEEQENVILEDAQFQVQKQVDRFRAQALRFALNDQQEVAKGIMSRLLVELDIATKLCVDVLSGWGVDDEKFVEIRGHADKKYDERYGVK